MALRVINHYPPINAINVPKNARIKVEFNKGINPASVNYTSFSVNDAGTYSTFPGNLGVEYNSSGVCTTAVFQPLIPMTANTKYRVYLFAAPNSIISVDNEQLSTAYNFEFVVGTGLLAEEFPEGIPSGDLPTSGVEESVVDSGIYDLTISGLQVIKTWPKHQTPNVPIDTGSVTILFNTNLAMTAEELSGYVAMTVTDVLY